MRSPELIELASDEALQARLEKALQGRRHRRVKVGLLCDGRMASAAVLDAAESARDAATAKRMRTGCLTKLFTWALAHQAVIRGMLRLQDGAGQRLQSAAVPAASRLGGITVAHLMAHTHGLDDSGLRDPRLLDDGRIDVGALIETVTSSPPLSAPGTLYSYSHAGALLVATVLEQAFGRPWYTLVRDELFVPLNIEHELVPMRAGGSESLRVCPSRGHDLVVPVAAMLGFLQKHGLNARIEETFALTKLPGWHSTEIGIRGGWKCYEGGWIGHNSEPPAPSAAVRVHAGERVAIVVEAGEETVAPILAALFGRLLPGLVRIRVPALLDAGRCAALDAGRYLGQYENGAQRVIISRSSAALLELRAHRRLAGVVEATPFLVTPLRAAQDEIFYPLPGGAPLAPFVQFSGESGGGFRYLWNGKSVWRNMNTG
jgi:hypothetical protein